MSKPPLIFAVVVVIIAVLATQRYMQKRRQDAVNDASPVRTLQAEVSAKREFPAPNRRSRQREVIAAEEMRYEVYFRPLSGGAEMMFALPEKTYHDMDKGMRGELSVQGTRFVDFRPDAAK
ncbi:DUF2500 domain-containing protein [Enterobacillus tribolii]|uniref:Uncharacterized protein DUF2500 n=1 Tax=Enterobacillus tribolii TaxID=1487935 RepID=A0A370QU15_9GAMM|nr:DUF2500 domain-containing protein [Enterobacillus tribolii]MBW7981203.1 DUF2500 domain-containing protein [Enterobacillus tribolii]RDK92738.1 uncharacterized protein DUF2500 [Enterobacillus tribolii]